MPPSREALVDAAARRLAADGPGGLSLRKLASDAGTSTMAIYTHFGGMPQLRKALRHRGYAALAAALSTVPAAEPRGRIAALCAAYVEWGLAEPALYREMYTEQPLDPDDVAACDAALAPLVDGVAACGFAGDPLALATELWVCGHGVVTLGHGGLLEPGQIAGVAAATVADLLAAFARR